MVNSWGNITIETVGSEPQPTVQAQVQTVEPTVTEPTAEVEPVVASPVVITEPLATDTDVTPPIVNNWEAELERVSGGRIKGEQSLTEILSQFDQRQAEADRLKAEIEATPTVAKKIAEMVKNGASDADLKNFYQMQLLDTTTMSKLDMVRQQVKAKSPIPLTDEQADILIEDNYGSLDVEEMTGVGKIKFEQAAHEAAAFINGQKISAENPDSVRAKTEAAAAEQQYQTTMQTSFTELYHSKVFTKLTVELDGETFDYQLTEKQQQEILNAAYYQMTQNKLPFDDNRRADIISKNAFALYGTEITKAVHKNAAARAKQQTVQELSGATVTPAITTPPTTVQKTGWAQIMEQR